MRVRVLLFASVREKAGVGTVEMELSGGATVAQAREELRQRFPALGERLSHCRFAVDREFAGLDAALHEGAEVAILPPVSGG